MRLFPMATAARSMLIGSASSLAKALPLVGLLALAACSPPSRDVVRTQILRPVVPPSARQACTPPAPLPQRSLTAREIVPLWGRDRTSLRECEERRAAAVRAVDAPPAEAAR
jgi:hypothetical protein